MRAIKSLFVFCFVILFIAGFSQSKTSLENKRKQLLKDIELTDKILRETSNKRKSSFKELKTLEQKISLREELIQNIIIEIKIIESSIDVNRTKIRQLNQDLDKLKGEYAALIRFAYRNQGEYNKLLYLFSANSVNDAFTRMKYINRLSAYQKRQTEVVMQTTLELDSIVMALENTKKDKQRFLNREKKQLELLDREKENKTSLVKKFNSREKELKKELADKKADAKRLNKAIAEIIKKEIETAKKRAEEEARKKSVSTITPELSKLSEDFKLNKGKLPWPTEKGVITSSYGKHKHPDLPFVEINNNGIDISSTNGALARCVFNGSITRVTYIPGSNYSVLVNHGNYYSVYSNLKEVFVKPGEKVVTKQNLGVIYTDDSNGETTLNFQVWEGINKQNPTNWIYRK